MNDAAPDAVLIKELIATGVVPEAAEWIALQGGRSNRIWRVCGNGADVVVKLFPENRFNPLFPNDPESEIAILHHLQDQNLSPRLLHHCCTPLGTCLVYAHLDGAGWQSDTAAAAKLLHRVHQLSPPAGLRRAPDGSAQLEQQTLAILAACRLDQRHKGTAHRPSGLVAPCGRDNLLHGDPVSGNMIVQGENLRLIDWQCPASGDPCEDIALFLSPAMQLIYRGSVLDPIECETFLDAYPDHATTVRYRQLAPWYHWRMFVYCLWKQGHGDPLAAKAAQAELTYLHMN